MRNNKLIFKLLLVVMLCILSLATLSGCGGEEVSELFISTKEAPRATYVAGQELDLSTGKLTYILNGEENELPLTAEGVSVSGYNKNQLGEQTVTVSYMEMTAEFKVNVIPRIKAESFETKYFIEDEFDKSKGKLVVARDDGTTFSVNMSNDKVSLVSFDSATAGEKEIKVKYSAGTADYECTFKVNVYGIANVTLKTPDKISYQSHDTELDFSGGYLNVKSTEESLSKFVPLTNPMVKVEGFDISQVTKEHMETPLKQKITITYGGQTFTYDISITYSGVSLINDLAKMFEGFDWDAENATIDTEKSEATIEAIKAYYKLSKAQRAQISTENTNTLVRATAIVVSLNYREAFKTYENTIEIGNNLSIMLVASSYEETLVDLEKLKNEDDTLNVYADILRKILEDFPNVVVAQGKTVEQIVAVHSNDIHDFLVRIFEHLTELYKTLENIPVNWTAEDLKANEDAIRVAINTIKTEEFVKTGYSYLYNDILSKWREKDDYLDILYYYYIHVKNDAENLFEDMFQKVPLPGIMQEWYGHIVNASNEVKWMQGNESGDAYLADVSFFMYYYREAMKATQAIKDSGNQLYLDIYEALDIDNINNVNIKVEGYGYFYQCGPMLDSERFMTLWEKYLDLVHILATDTLDKTKNDAEFKLALEAFNALSPAELYGFLTSLNFQYDDARGSVLVLEYGENPKNMFIDMMGQYCYHVLNDACEPLFVDLLVAMEKYALLGAPNAKPSTLADFETAMAEVIKKYNALSTTDQKNFDTYLGTSYNKYLNLYNVCKNGAADLGTNAATFDELALVMNRFHAVLELFSSKEEGVKNEGTMALLVALYERAKTLYETILATEDPNVIAALNAKNYTVDGEELPLDLAFARVRFVAIYNIMLNYVIQDGDDETYDPRVWDKYSITKADELLLKVIDVLYGQYDSNAPKLSKEAMLAIMAQVREIMLSDIESVRIFSSIQGDVYYYAGVTAFLKEALSDDGDALADKLVSIEKIYRNYLFSEKEEYMTSFKTSVEELKAAYASASDADKAYLDAMYTFYVSIYDALEA